HCTTAAGSFAGAHHGLAHLAHYRTDVGEVEVDQAFLDHQVGDAGNARVEHLVGHRECVGEGGLVVGDAEQVLVRDDDQGVDAGLKLLDALLCSAHAALTFEVERLGHNADRQNATLTGCASDDRSRTRTRTTTHAGGDEAHVRACQLRSEEHTSELQSR